MLEVADFRTANFLTSAIGSAYTFTPCNVYEQLEPAYPSIATITFVSAGREGVVAWTKEPDPDVQDSGVRLPHVPVKKPI